MRMRAQCMPRTHAQMHENELCENAVLAFNQPIKAIIFSFFFAFSEMQMPGIKNNVIRMGIRREMCSPIKCHKIHNLLPNVN